MHIFVKCHLFDSFDALATNTQNFSQNVGTERRREISRTGRGIFVLSERTLEHFYAPDAREGCLGALPDHDHHHLTQHSHECRFPLSASFYSHC